jgi:hypothetical protein
MKKKKITQVFERAFDFCEDNYIYFDDNFELLKTFYLTCLEAEYYYS